MQRRSVALIYYIVLIVLSGVFVLYRAIQFGQYKLDKGVKAREGVLDLRSSSLENKIIPLEGEFEFYWSNLYTPADFDSTPPPRTGYIHVPGLWNGYSVNDSVLKGQGYATYRLRILLPRGGMYAVKIKEFDCAYHLWVNGSETGAGKVGTRKATMVPSWKRKEVYFATGSKEVEMILQVSNFHHRKGGPEELMLFGDAGSIMKYKTVSVATETFVLGFILLTFFFHLGLYFFQPKEKAHIHFALLNLLIGLRLVMSGEKLFLELFPSIPWLWAVRIEYLSIILPPAVYLFFLHKMYPELERKAAKYTTIAYLSVFSLIVLLFSPLIFTYLAVIIQPFVLIAIVYAFFLLAKVMRRRDRYTIFIIIGTVVFALTGVNEYLFYNQLLHTGYLLPYSSVLLIFTFSFGLSGRFTNALDEAQRLRGDIEAYSHTLEEKVKERTLVTENQKKLLEIQTEELKMAIHRQQELGKFKDTMVNLVVHDMKNPLAAIINLDEQASKEQIMLAQYAGNQLLNLVQNIMEIQKFEETGIKINPADHNLRETAGTAIHQVAFLAEHKGVAIHNSIGEGCFARYDPHMIERVFMNLLQNALKHTPSHGSVTIDASEGRKEWTLSVTDTGIGIPAEFHSVIFEKYGQVETTSTKRSTGLGLTFCKMAVEAHHGKIGVESEPGKGSTFWFTLPA
jgi:signal transduction histidine kinase